MLESILAGVVIGVVDEVILVVGAAATGAPILEFIYILVTLECRCLRIHFLKLDLNGSIK